MPGKRRPCSGVEAACRGTRVIWRRLDCVNPNPQVMKGRIRRNHARYRRRALPRLDTRTVATSRARTMPSEGMQGDEWDAYVTLSRTTRTNMGSPTGRQVLWRRRPRSSRRSNDRPRRAGEPSTGRRGLGGWTPQDREVCEMQSAETVLGVLRERGRRGLPSRACTGSCSTRSCICWPMGACTPTTER
jgi:hypothetical protein